MGISNTQMYETAVRAIAKQRVALEVMSYHAIAPEEDAQRLKVGFAVVFFFSFYFRINFHKTVKIFATVFGIYIGVALDRINNYIFKSINCYSLWQHN